MLCHIPPTIIIDSSSLIHRAQPASHCTDLCTFINQCRAAACHHQILLTHQGVEFDRISLQRAIVNGHVAVVELLIRSGCPMEFETTGYHRVWSALHDAVRLNILTILDLLCRLGMLKQSAQHSNRFQMCRFESGADLEFASELSGTAFALACRQMQCFECASVLADFGCNLNPTYLASGHSLEQEV